MSMHRQKDHPALETAILAQGLPIDKPSQPADFMRVGWGACVSALIQQSRAEAYAEALEAATGLVAHDYVCDAIRDLPNPYEVSQ